MLPIRRPALVALVLAAGLFSGCSLFSVDVDKEEKKETKVEEDDHDHSK